MEIHAESDSGWLTTVISVLIQTLIPIADFFTEAFSSQARLSLLR